MTKVVVTKFLSLLFCNIFLNLFLCFRTPHAHQIIHKALLSLCIFVLNAVVTVAFLSAAVAGFREEGGFCSSVPNIAKAATGSQGAFALFFSLKKGSHSLHPSLEDFLLPALGWENRNATRVHPPPEAMQEGIWDFPGLPVGNSELCPWCPFYFIHTGTAECAAWFISLLSLSPAIFTPR